MSRLMPSIDIAWSRRPCSTCIPAPQHTHTRLLKRRSIAACSASTTSSKGLRQPDLGGPLAVSFSLIVDDIVYPDGSSLMAQVGGGGPQTLFGYQLYHAQRASVGLAAGVGPDLPQSATEWLSSCGVQLGALLLREHATPRAWQVLENDGRRAEVWRSLLTPQQLSSALRPPLSELPPAYWLAKSYHVAVNPDDPHLEHLRQLSGLISVETFRPAAAPLPAHGLRKLMVLCDIFSPNEAEALSMLPAGTLPPPQPGATDPENLAADAEARQQLLSLSRPFVEAGARLVAVRRGAQGAVIHSKQGEAWLIPAYPGTRVVDTTGCGNAFCGALLAATQAGERLEVAGAWGCVAGSIMAEHRGVPEPSPAQLHGEAQRRVAELLPLVVPLARS